MPDRLSPQIVPYRTVMLRRSSDLSHFALTPINENKFNAILMKKILAQLNVRIVTLALGVTALVAGSALAASHLDTAKTKPSPDAANVEVDESPLPRAARPHTSTTQPKMRKK